MDKTNMCKTRDFLLKMHETSRKLAPKGVQKGEFETGVAPLWAPLAPNLFFGAKSASKRLQKWPQGA